MKNTQIVFAVIGNVLISTGVTMLNLTGFGVDSFTSLTLGLSSLLGISLGLFQMCMNILILIPVILLNRRSFGAGTLINLFLNGYIVEYLSKFIGMFNITTDNLHDMFVLRILLIPAAIVILCLGCAFCMDSGLGTGSYDAVAPTIEARTCGRISFKNARMLCDLTVTIIGFISGRAAGVTTVGMATICVAFMTGPMIAFLRKNITRKLMMSRIPKSSDMVEESAVS